MAFDGCTLIASANALRWIGPRLATITNARNWTTVRESSTAAIDCALTPTSTREAANTASTCSSRCLCSLAAFDSLAMLGA